MCLPDWVTAALTAQYRAAAGHQPTEPKLTIFIHSLPKETIKR